MPVALRQVGLGISGYASDVFTTPWPQLPGDRARDRNGNEFVFVDFATGGMSIGSVCVIDFRFRAVPCNSSAPAGKVGVVVALNPTTDQAGWVQIFGFALVQGTGFSGTASVSDVSDTSTRRVLCPTSVLTSPAGAVGVGSFPIATSEEQSSVEINEIFGMWLAFGDAITDYPGFDGTLSSFDHVVSGANVTQVSDTSGAVTNTTVGIAQGLIPVVLNYPYHLNTSRNLSAITS